MKQSIAVKILLLISMVFVGCSPDKENYQHHYGWYGDPAKVRANQEALRSLTAKSLSYLKEGRPYLADGATPSQCVATRYQYFLIKIRNKLNVFLNLRLSNEDGSELASRNFEQVGACVPKLIEVWKRYDITFNLSIYEAEKGAQQPNTVFLTNKKGRSNASHYYLGGDFDFCATFVHEIGHLVGFADEYFEEGTCRTSEYKADETSPWSFMEGFYSWDYTDFLPRHIVQLVKQALPTDLRKRAFVDEKGRVSESHLSIYELRQLAKNKKR